MRILPYAGGERQLGTHSIRTVLTREVQKAVRFCDHGDTEARKSTRRKALRKSGFSLNVFLRVPFSVSPCLHGYKTLRPPRPPR